MAVLDRLRVDLACHFDVVDHWEAETCAVGIARPSDHRILVYISTFPPHSGAISYECERPPTAADFPYDTDGMREVPTYEELRDAARTHLDDGR